MIENPCDVGLISPMYDQPLWILIPCYVVYFSL